MKQKKILLFLILGILSACSQRTEPAPAPLSPDELPTIVALTGQAAFATANALTPSATPTLLPTETPTPEPTSALPTVTPTFEPGFTKFADLRFVAPGPMSNLASPIQLKLLLSSGKSNLVRIDLLGEEGRTLYSELIRVSHDSRGAYRELEIPFEIRAVSEKGYIRLSSKDEFRRLQKLNTMPILLYSMGASEINLPGNMIYERVMFEGLKDGADVYNGEIAVKGRYWPFNTQPVFLDLTLESGKVITSRLLPFKGIEPESFETTLPYKVTEPAKARIVIRQDNPEIRVVDTDLKNYIYLYSIEVTLNP
jgi:hypothetical protein